MKGKYSQNYDASITIGNYVTIGTTSSGGSTSLSSLSNTTSNPSSSSDAQFYIRFNGAGRRQYSGTNTTSILITYDNGDTHIISVRLVGSDSGDDGGDDDGLE